jgi:hypothetical protein
MFIMKGRVYYILGRWLGIFVALATIHHTHRLRCSAFPMGKQQLRDKLSRSELHFPGRVAWCYAVVSVTPILQLTQVKSRPTYVVPAGFQPWLAHLRGQERGDIPRSMSGTAVSPLRANHIKTMENQGHRFFEVFRCGAVWEGLERCDFHPRSMGYPHNLGCGIGVTDTKVFRPCQEVRAGTGWLS